MESNKDRGFTFTELIIVVGIILLLGVSVSVSYRQSQYRNDLKNSAEKIASSLRRTQSLGLNGTVQNINDSADKRYGIALTSPSGYTMYRDINGNEYFDIDDEVLLVEEMASHVSILNVSGGQTFSIAFPYAAENSEVHYYDGTTGISQSEFVIDVFSDRTNTNTSVVLFTSGVVDVYN